jgi:RNA polymerase sigma-70 factor (ECF subfamily)
MSGVETADRAKSSDRARFSRLEPYYGESAGGFTRLLRHIINGVPADDRPMHEDLAIVRKLLDGDEQMFKAVFDGYFPRLYRFVVPRVGGNADEARDIVQHAFCKAVERLDSYRGEASLYGWMLQICRNTLIDRVRRDASRPQHFSLGDNDNALESIVEALRAPENEQPDHRAARLDLLRIIEATLDYLPSHYGDVLEWKYVEGSTVNEIAARLNLAPKAAESLLTRARSAFREAIVTIQDSADLLPFEIDKGPRYARD